MGPYWPEFLKVALAHLLGVASPGPDFALVLKQSLRHGRHTAVWTAIGIGSGICLHVTYSLLGIGVLLMSSKTAFTILKFSGAAYLAWLGVHDLRARPRSGPADEKEREAPLRPGARSAFAAGFMVNALNPKAGLFFIALFAVIVSPRTPKLVQAGYGAWVSLTTMAWFSMVAYVFTRQRVREVFLRHGHWIDRALGAVFIAFAASLALASL